MEPRKPSRILFVVLVIVVIAAAGAASALVYEFNKPKAPHPLLTVQEGDNITVNYIGVFGSGGQAGRVFDTSFQSIATNNVTYPKSLEYEPRPSSGYTPLPVHVGPTTPQGGYVVGNLTFDSVVTGFWQGLLGLQGNQTATIVVPPNLGYGPLNQSCIGTAPLSFTVPVLTNVAASRFSAQYPGVNSTVGVVFLDPTYGWNDTVFSVNSTTVVVRSSASLGESIHPNGLPFVVAALNATTISVSSLLTPANAGAVLGHVTSGGLCGSTYPLPFIVSAVNFATGTYTMNFNPEVQGETLDFVVTVVDIFPA